MGSLWKMSAAALALAFLAVVAFALSKGGDSGRSHRQGGGSHGDGGGSQGGDVFSWLRSTAVPSGWRIRRLPDSPASLAAPPGWHLIRGDPGTATMVIRAPSGHIVGYLNATPREGRESTANWHDFRVDHNREEGDRDVRLLAAASGLRFRSGTGACVIDSYLTSTGARYREIACLDSGRTASTVIVAAAPPSRWAREAPLLKRAVSSFTT